MRAAVLAGVVVSLSLTACGEHEHSARWFLQPSFDHYALELLGPGPDLPANCVAAGVTFHDGSPRASFRCDGQSVALEVRRANDVPAGAMSYAKLEQSVLVGPPGVPDALVSALAARLHPVWGTSVWGEGSTWWITHDGTGAHYLPETWTVSWLFQHLMGP